MSVTELCVRNTDGGGHVSRAGHGRRWLAGLAAISLAFAACSDDGDDGDASAETDGEPTGTTEAGGGSETTDTEASPGTTAAEAGTETTSTDAGSGAGGPEDADPEGVIRMGYDLVTEAAGGIWFDPGEVATQLQHDGLYYYIYGSLMRPTADGELVPDLAEGTEAVDENTIEITLREELTFSDGTPFDAEAVKAGLERSLAAENSAGFGTSFFDLETVEVTSPTEVTLTIPNGTAPSWHDTYIGSWETAIVKPGHEDFDQPVGAGPMQMTEHQPEQRMVLEKNPNYWDSDSILVSRLELIHAPSDSQAGVSALSADQVDMAQIQTAMVPAVSDDDEILVETDPNTLMSLMVCKSDGPLADPMVRKALNLAIDRDAINEAVFDGTYTPGLGLWPEDHRFHNPDVSAEFAYDPERARQLLDEAGYGDGFNFDLYVIPVAGMPEVTQVMQQQYAEIGVTANLITSPDYVADFLEARKPGAGAVPTMSANRLKLLQWTGESIGNTCLYDDPELNALAEELGTVSDSSDEAVDLWHEIEAHVAEEALSVFILFGTQVLGYDPDLIGNPTLMPFVIVVPELHETYVKAES